MKIKPLYIYAIIIVIAVIFLIIFTGSPENQSAKMTGEMPQDEVHKGLSHPGFGSPSEANVSDLAKKKMEALKSGYDQNKDDTLKAREYADFLAAAHKPLEAIPLYQNILKKDFKRTDIRFSLALIFYNQGDFNSAEQIISEVLDYDKNNREAKYNLGAIAASKGDKEKAKRIWEELIIKYPETEISKMARESIKNLNN
jgi:TolA-binding protein